MIVLLQIGVYGLAGFVLAATLSAILFARRPLLGVAQHWGLQLWWLALLGLVAAPIRGAWPAAIACLCCALYWSLRIFRRPRPRVPAARPLLRLASANVAHFNRDHDCMLAALAACAADVIALVEVTPACRDRLRELDATHPHAVDSCDLSEKYGVLVRARWPMTAVSRGGGGDGAPRHVSVRLQLETGALDLMAVHLTNPIRRAHAHRIPGEIDDVIARANRAGPDLVLCGDCNAAGWSSWLRRLEAATGLDNTRRLLPSWPVRLPPFLRLPIDHAWARGRAVVLTTRLGPETGSDHFPLLAEIGWRDG
ncbi:MAG TPA: endonuclease/exonuclease/phosphatase family protein [Alphaproteobacteria bacterium]|nr:endonuclease/exonuclease/phosphatase family protein [Alphaproteobacteria bacterium]